MKVLVTGASSQIGSFLLPRLVAAGYRVVALSRKSHKERSPGVEWRQTDLRGRVEWGNFVGCAALIHVAQLPLLPPHIERLAEIGITRTVAFSSTSRLTKARSEDPDEREVAVALAVAEQGTQDGCGELGISWTLFRPTMIYGAGTDRNVSSIAEFVRRYRFFPLVGAGKGLRQPVHADDLAAACVAALHQPATYRKVYELAGAETLSFRAMVERIFSGLGIPPRFLPVPVVFLRTALRMGRRLPGYSHLNPEMANRMNLDMCFDISPAVADFAFKPRGFAFDNRSVPSTCR